MESLLEDSNRLAPFTLALLDDLASTTSMAAYRRHLIRRWTEGEEGGLKRKIPAKQLTILCLQEGDKEAFVAANQQVISANVLLLGDEDFEGEEEILKSEHILKRLAGRAGRPAQSADSSHHRVLVIDSVVPLLMEAMTTGQEESCSVQAATKAVAAWLGRLHQEPQHFSHIVFTLHTDVFGGSSAHQYVELA